MLVIKLED